MFFNSKIRRGFHKVKWWIVPNSNIFPVFQKAPVIKNFDGKGPTDFEYEEARTENAVATIDCQISESLTISS